MLTDALLSGLNFSVSMAAVNQTAKITFTFNEGTEGQRAVFDSNASVSFFKLDYVSYGGSLMIYGKSTADGTTQTLFQPVSQETGASSQNAIDFMVSPKYCNTKKCTNFAH